MMAAACVRRPLGQALRGPAAIALEWQYAAAVIAMKRDGEWDKNHNPSRN
jgi:hypothetical protein